VSDVDPDGTPGTDPGPAELRIAPIELKEQMQRSYLDYAMSVIVSRALPDVRDGLKPVHRRVLYAMYDGGYRPDRNFSKSARVVGDVMGSYHPHGDTAIYDTLVRLTQAWVLRYPLVAGQGNFGSPGNDGAAAARYTECRMAPLAMEMVRDIDEDTVDFQPNYDGRTAEPVVLPSRFPNLLVNGSAGIAVGMATNIPPHNLREVADGIAWALEHPDADRATLLEALLERIPGPDFPTGGLVVGRRGIEDAYRTGRGLITMRAVVQVEENAKGQTLLAVTQLPYQVNPDNLLLKIVELHNAGKVAGIADVIDQSAGDTLRLEIVLKRDAVPQVVLNQLYKHTQLQETFGANMVALVDGVPRTLPLDAFVRHWVAHQLEVIRRRTEYRLRKRRERLHILLALLKAIDVIDEVIALIRGSASAAEASSALQDFLDIDDVQAQAILDLQLRKLAALERQQLQDEYDRLLAEIADLDDILARDERKREIVGAELSDIVARFGDERRTSLEPDTGDLTNEDLIPVEDVVVTITRGGYAKRTKVELYRQQRRGGRGVRGATLREDDVVEHFFVTTTHHWLLVFTNRGQVYRVKAYQLPDVARDAKGQHVANLLAFQPDERIAAVLALRDYEQSPYLVTATRHGMVKKTRLTEYDSPLSKGLRALTFRSEDDELVGVGLVTAQDHVLLVSRRAQAIRFVADDTQLRPMGRVTGGVRGMQLRGVADGPGGGGHPPDEVLAMSVIPAGDDDAARFSVFTVTDGGFAKRTPVTEYRVQQRAGLGIRAARLSDERGSLVGALVVTEDDDVLAIRAGGSVTRTPVSEVRPTGRDTMGVKFVSLDEEDPVVAVARAADDPAAESDQDAGEE
jgi:DNA gyrase subunit A